VGNGSGSGFKIPVTASPIGLIASTGVFAPGTGYGPASKTYEDVALTKVTGSGNGSGAKANITVNAAGVVTDVELVSYGTNYAVGDVLGVAPSALGNSAGKDFGLTVASIGDGGEIDDTTSGQLLMKTLH
jgi:hypothetical protein